MAQSGRRLTARPVESEQPVAEINYFQELQFMRNSVRLSKRTLFLFLLIEL
jgi:hypothetical protein